MSPKLMRTSKAVTPSSPQKLWSPSATKRRRAPAAVIAARARAWRLRIGAGEGARRLAPALVERPLVVPVVDAVPVAVALARVGLGAVAAAVAVAVLLAVAQAVVVGVLRGRAGARARVAVGLEAAWVGGVDRGRRVRHAGRPARLEPIRQPVAVG